MPLTISFWKDLSKKWLKAQFYLFWLTKLHLTYYEFWHPIDEDWLACPVISVERRRKDGDRLIILDHSKVLPRCAAFVNEYLKHFIDLVYLCWIIGHLNFLGIRVWALSMLPFYSDSGFVRNGHILQMVYILWISYWGYYSEVQNRPWTYSSWTIWAWSIIIICHRCWHAHLFGPWAQDLSLSSFDYLIHASAQCGLSACRAQLGWCFGQLGYCCAF